MSAPTSSDSILSKFAKVGIKPINRESILFHYAPIAGVGSYGLLAINVMNPGLLGSIFPKRDVTNILLFHSCVGAGLHIYNRPHLHNAPAKYRLMYSTYGALVFGFGSVLIWALLSQFFRHSRCISSILGLGSGITLVAVGKEYLEFIDSQIPKK